MQEAGDLESAEQTYGQIVTEDPQHSDAWQFLGVIAYQRRKHSLAVDLISKAIAIHGDRALVLGSSEPVNPTLTQIHTLGVAVFSQRGKLQSLLVHRLKVSTEMGGESSQLRQWILSKTLPGLERALVVLSSMKGTPGALRESATIVLESNGVRETRELKAFGNATHNN